MRERRRITVISLIAAVVVLGSMVLLPGAGTALGPIEGGGWELTTEAQIRTAAGDCPAGMVCLEWCYNGQATGDFMCFNSIPQ